MNDLINTIDKLASEMSEEEHKLYTKFFLEALDMGLGLELEEIIDKHFVSLFSEVLGKNLSITINYKSDYHIKIRLSSVFLFHEIDVIPYKLIEGKEMIGCTNDLAILPISEALRSLYPVKYKFTDKLLTITVKTNEDNYHPWLFSFKSSYTDELLEKVPINCNYLPEYESYPKYHKYYHPLIMYAFKKQWARDLIIEIKEVIALVKKVIEDDSRPELY